MEDETMISKTNTRANRLTFTVKAIGNLPPAQNPRGDHYYDTHARRLAIRVMPSGSKMFYFIACIAGRTRRIKLGIFPVTSIDEARAEAVTIFRTLSTGIDPRADRIARQNEPTVGDLFVAWLARAKMHKKTWRDDQRIFIKYMESLQGVRTLDLTTLDVSRWHTAICHNHGPIMANRARSLLSAMFGRAAKDGQDLTNPVSAVERFPEKSRERFLQPDEMGPFLTSVEAEPPMWCAFWKIVLFTGARRGNVAAMAWADVDLAGGLWHIPGQSMKSGRPTTIALVLQVTEILQARRAADPDGQWVFPSRDPARPITDPRTSWAGVVKRAGLADLHPHDLRRTLGSWQAIAGQSLAVIGKALGHVDLKSTQVYSRLDLAPVRESVGRSVTAMIESGRADTVKK